jgi:hypothetical protein
MLPRTALLGFALALVPACKEGSAQSTDTGVWSGGDGTDGADGTDGTTDGDSLVGRWQRDEPFDFGDFVATVIWTGSDDGGCEVELQADGFAEAFDCTYTAEAGDFTMQDDGCPGDVGRYTYSVSGDTLTLSLVDDPCEERSDALPATWTRTD